MAVDLPGYWFIDNLDLWVNFKTGITKGTADTLKYPPKKVSIEYDWFDENGIDVDLSAPKYAARDVQLSCFIITQNKAEFWDNHNALINHLMSPGIHNLSFASHGLTKIYGVHYVETNSYLPERPLRIDDTLENFHQFTLVLREVMPTGGGTSTNRIIDTPGRYIVT